MAMRTLALIGAISLTTIAATAQAATVTSVAFAAVVAPTIAFLDESGRLASQTSDDPRVRGFARSVIATQGQPLRRLAQWRRVETEAMARDAAAPTLDHLGPVANLVALPYEALANATSSAAPPLTDLPSAARLDAAARNDLAELARLHGPAFTDHYAASQVVALQRLVSAYKAFILNGDDPILRALAVRGLPSVENLLARARRL